MKRLLKRMVLVTLSLIILVLFIPVYSSDGSPSPEEISYSTSSGTFMFSNNPERVIETDLADKGRILYHQKELSGNIQVFFTHMNKCDYDIYFGVQLYNFSNKTVKIKVENRGISAGKSDDAEARGECWEDFYDDTLDKVYIMPAQSTVWILGGSDPQNDDYDTPVTHKNWICDGVVKFNASSKVNVNVYAYKRFSETKNANNSPLDYVTEDRFGDTQYNKYKGISKRLPVLKQVLSWTIYDKTSGALPVRYKDGNRKSIQSDGWITNFKTTKMIQSLYSDLFSFTYKDNNNKTTVIPSKDGMNNNRGNWGVKYTDKVKITNKAKVTKWFAYKIINNSEKGPTTWATIIWDDGNPDNLVLGGGDYMISSPVSVKPGKSAILEISTTLCGNSHGNFLRQVIVADEKRSDLFD